MATARSAAQLLRAAAAVGGDTTATTEAARILRGDHEDAVPVSSGARARAAATIDRGLNLWEEWAVAATAAAVAADEEAGAEVVQSPAQAVHAQRISDTERRIQDLTTQIDEVISSRSTPMGSPSPGSPLGYPGTSPARHPPPATASFVNVGTSPIRVPLDAGTSPIPTPVPFLTKQEEQRAQYSRLSPQQQPATGNAQVDVHLARLREKASRVGQRSWGWGSRSRSRSPVRRQTMATAPMGGRKSPRNVPGGSKPDWIPAGSPPRREAIEVQTMSPSPRSRRREAAALAYSGTVEGPVERSKGPLRASEVFAMRCARVPQASPTYAALGLPAFTSTEGSSAALTALAPTEAQPTSGKFNDLTSMATVDVLPEFGANRGARGGLGERAIVSERPPIDGSLLQRAAQRPAYAPADDADRLQFDTYHRAVATNAAAGLARSLMPHSTLTGGDVRGGDGAAGSRGVESYYVDANVESGDGFKLTAGGRGGTGQGHGDGFVQSAMSSATPSDWERSYGGSDEGVHAEEPPPLASHSDHDQGSDAQHPPAAPPGVRGGTAGATSWVSGHVAGSTRGGDEFSGEEAAVQHLRQELQREAEAGDHGTVSGQDKVENELNQGEGRGEMASVAAALEAAKAAASVAMKRSGIQPTPTAVRAGIQAEGDAPHEGTRRTLWTESDGDDGKAG